MFNPSLLLKSTVPFLGNPVSIFGPVVKPVVWFVKFEILGVIKIQGAIKKREKSNHLF